MRSEKWIPYLLVGLLALQTVLLTAVILRLNSIQSQLAGLGGGGGGGSVGAVVSEEKIEVDPGTGPSKGKKGAPVTIVEFSDFTCPSCAELQPVLKEVLNRYPDRVHLAFRYFPLSTKGKPMLLATAAECAHRQEKFWEAHDLLYAKSIELTTEDDVQAALAGLGLDMEAFDTCLASQEAAERPRQDFEAGRRYGVSSTPTLFVNGRRVLGSDAEGLERLIQSEL